jgi:NAD-specific glutamate dehydrogenase
MADQNQDLPLIVSEILIEMHEMKDDIRAMQGDIKSMTEALNRTASVVSKQQEHTNRIMNVFQEESKNNTEFMTYSISKALGQQQVVNQDFESRLKRLEQQYQ